MNVFLWKYYAPYLFEVIYNVDDNSSNITRNKINHDASKITLRVTLGIKQTDVSVNTSKKNKPYRVMSVPIIMKQRWKPQAMSYKN